MTTGDAVTADEKLGRAVELAVRAQVFADRGKDNAALSYLAAAVGELADGVRDLMRERA